MSGWGEQGLGEGNMGPMRREYRDELMAYHGQRTDVRAEIQRAYDEARAAGSQ